MALLIVLPVLAHAGVREELMALEAKKSDQTVALPPAASPVVPPPSLMQLPDGRQANMKDYQRQPDPGQ